MEQIAAVEEWNDLDSARKNAVVEFVDLLVNSFKGKLRVFALLQQHNPFDHIGIVENLAILTIDDLLLSLFFLVVNTWVGGTPRVRLFGHRHCTEAARFADLTESNLRSLYDRSNVFYSKRRTRLRLENRVLNVADVSIEANLSNVDLLLALFDETPTGVDIVVGKLLLDLTDAQPVGDEFVGIDPYLVLARNAAEARNIDNSGNRLELLFERPVLDRLEVHVVVKGIGAAQRVPEYLAYRTPVGADLRLQASRK